MPVLPPVVATLLANTDEFMASMDAAKAEVADFAATADTAGAAAATGLTALGATARDEVAPAFDDIDKQLADSALFDLPALSPQLAKVAEDAEEAGGDIEKSGSRAASGFHKLGDILENTGVPFGNVAHKIGSDLENVEKSGSSSFAGLAHAGKIAAIGLIGAFVGVAAESVHLSDQFEPAQAALKTSINATGQSFAAWGPQISDLQNRFAGLGFNMTDTDGALQTLVTSTGNVKRGYGEMGLAANVARLNNISLAAAATMVAKANAGSARIMTMWGINANIAGGKAHAVQTASEGLATAQLNLRNVQKEVADGAIKSSEAEEELASAHRAVMLAAQKHTQAEEAIGQILATVSGRVKDAAYNYGQTLAGKMHIAGAEVENLGVKFGLVLVPAILKAITVVGHIVDWFKQHEEVTIALGVAVGTVLVAALAAYTAGLIAAAAAELVALAPVIAITAAVAALGVGIFELVTHWATVWDFIKRIAADAWHYIDDKVIHPIADAFVEVINFVKKHWEVIAAILIAPIAPVLAVFLLFHDQIIHFFDDIWHAVDTAWNAMYNNVFHPMIEFFQDAFTSQIKAAELDWNDVWGGIKTAALVVWRFLDDDIFHPFIAFFAGPFKDTITAAKEFWDAAWDFIKTTALEDWHIIYNDILQPVVSFFEGVWHSTVTGAQNIWDSVWNGIKTTVQTVWNFMKNDVFDPIASFFWGVWHSTITAALAVWNTVWDGIKSAVEDAWNFIKPIFDAITGGIRDITSAVGGVIGTLGKIAGATGSVTGWIGKHLAGGGLVTSPTIAMIGESGPELVLNAQQTQQALSGGVSHPALGSVGSSGGSQVNQYYVTISGAGLNEQQLANLVRVQLLQLSRGTRNAFGVFAGS